MKRMFSHCCIVVCTLWAFGCAGERVRTVQDDNIFFSSSKPKIRIKLNPQFKAFKDEKLSDIGFSSDASLASTNIKFENYLFVKSDADRIRMIQIIFQELSSPRWSFEQDIFPFDNVYDKGYVKFNKISYQYCISANNSSGRFTIISSIGRLVGLNDEAMIIINYSENVSGDWSDLKNMTKNQKEYIIGFISESRNDIKILKKD